MILQEIRELLKCFPKSFINNNLEFIAHLDSNTYFSLEDCEDVTMIRCKVLEYLSRACYKTQPYRKDSKNKEFHEFMLKCVNEYLGTNFDEKDIEIIYTKLGNGIRSAKTLEFVLKDYDMGILEVMKE